MFLTVATLVFFGCATPLQKGSPAYVYVAQNGIVTFKGEAYRSSEIPEELIRAGATPSTHIFIIPQGDVPMAHMNTIVSNCGNAGLPNCTIRQNMKITITTGKK